MLRKATTNHVLEHNFTNVLIQNKALNQLFLRSVSLICYVVFNEPNLLFILVKILLPVMMVIC